MTGDHFFKNAHGQDDGEEDPSFPCDTVALVLYDRATRWLAVYPKSIKSASHTIEAMQHFAGPKDKIASFYCDNAPELISGPRALKWRLATATTGMPQTNGVAENCVRRTKEGGGCGIVQSGFNPQSFWPEAGQHYCFSTNIAIFDGDSTHNRRHRLGHFKGQYVPFGAYVDFMPQPETRVESMGAKTIPGVFIGYHVHPGGLWSGDYLIADFAPFRRDCNVAKIKVNIHRVREIVMNRTGDFSLPVASLRQKRLLSADDDSNAPNDDEMPELVPTSDDEAPDPETGDDEEGPSSSNAYLNGIADPRVDADALPPSVPRPRIPSYGIIATARWVGACR